MKFASQVRNVFFSSVNLFDAKGIVFLQIQNNKLAGVQLTSEYRGALSTSSLTLANLDLVNESGILVGSYLRRITPRLDAGVELVYQYGRQIPGRQISVLSYAARYAGKK